MSPGKPVSPEKRKNYKGKKIPDFCRNMQARRLELRITQEQLGKLIGAPKTRISEMEAGRFPTDPERIVAIARSLGVSLDWLFTGEGEIDSESKKAPPVSETQKRPPAGRPNPIAKTSKTLLPPS